MTKTILFLIASVTFYSVGYCQTRDIDYDYIIAHYTSQEVNANYKKKELSQSEIPKGSDIKAIIQFTLFSTISDNKDRGVALVYKEKNSNNDFLRTIIICIPEAGSDSGIKLKSLNAIRAIDDMFILKSILMAILKLGVKTD